MTFTDANGQVTRRQYDGNGNLTRQLNALNQETRYEYEGENRLIRVIDAKNQVTQLGYDAKGRLISLTNPLGDTQTLEYDAADNLLKRFDALGKTVISLNYDELNNPTRVTDALANHTFFDYDELSRLTQTTDSLAAGTQFRYDDLNRLIASVDALTGVSSQNFDADGNRDHLTDPNRHPTQFDWDLSGRLVQETVATGNQVKYSYNARNLLAQLTNARGQPRQLEYDAAGRLTHFTDIDGTVSFTYDNNGNVLTVSDSQGTITRTYDALNRIASYTDVNGNTLHYEYDEVGNLVTLAYPDGKLVHYEYDANDQLVKVTDWAGRETRYEYDANGRLIKTIRPNGTSQTRQYDVKGQLLAQTDLDAQGKLLVAYTFKYDAAGNLVQEQVTPEGLPVLPTSVKMTYTAANRLATYNGQAVQFDADGNLLTAPLNGQLSPLQFDSRNRLSQAGNITYRYDAENQRIGVNQTSYVINSQPALSQVLVKEENGVKTFYVYGLGLIGEEKDGEYRSYHFDFRGSTVAITDQTGKVVERFQYGPYGELPKGEVSVTPFLFNGLYGVMTDESGLYYMRARYYSPEIKRFVNQDILLGNITEGQTLNRFAFVNSNPISYIDPEGKLVWWIIPIITIGLTVADVVIPPTLPEGHEQDAITPSIGPLDLVTGIGGGAASLIKGACRISGTGAFLEGSKAGMGLGKLADREIKLSERGLELVKKHLAQFDDIPENNLMIARLELALKEGKTIMGADASFYLHEVTEAVQMGRGLNYDVAHAAALAKYEVSPFSVYHPDVIQAVNQAQPGSFNSNWLIFWELQ